MIWETKINFEKIRAMVDAAANLQEAGQADKAREVLSELASMIIEDVA